MSFAPRYVNVVTNTKVEHEAVADFEVILRKAGGVCRKPLGYVEGKGRVGVVSNTQEQAGEAVARPSIEITCLRSLRLTALEIQEAILLVMGKGGVLLVAPVNTKLQAVAAFLPAYIVVYTKAVVDIIVVLISTQGCIAAHIDLGKTDGERGA